MIRTFFATALVFTVCIHPASAQFRGGGAAAGAPSPPPSTGAAAPGAEQGDDAVTVTKRDKRSIAIVGLSGSELQRLARMLTFCGAFSVVESGPTAEFTVDARSGGGVQARLKARTVAELLARTYSGTGREPLQRLSDDIVEAITGKRGFATTKIAFVGTRTGRKEIYMCDADGGNVIQLTRDAVLSVSPSISGDARSILYTGYHGGYPDVYRIDLNSGARTRIMKYPGTNSGAVFSPDQSRIAVTLSKDGNPELYVTGASGGGARRLTRSRGVESSPSWSPDGSEIVYSNDDGGSPALYRIPANGGSPVRIETGSSYNTEPSWSPDGGKIAWTVRSGGSFQVGVLSLENGRVRLLGSGQDPSWAPNSRHLVCTDGSGLVLLDSQTGQRHTLLDGVGKSSEPAWSR
jgi:TolB protein